MKYIIFEVGNDDSTNVNGYIESKEEEWNLAMASTEMKQKHHHFGGGFETFLISMLYKMQIIFLVNKSMGLILGNDTNGFFPFIRRSSRKSTPTLPLVQQILPTQLNSMTTCT